jgi:prepilin-type N-terminal cleavage/methylation domain-containing protein/prepilin-type processing-associated H-X9-DG protein
MIENQQIRGELMNNRIGRPGFTLLELLVVIGIVAVLLALLLSAVQRARASAGRAGCTNNLRQAGIALHNYHGVYGSFPPGVRASSPYPFAGWEARLLPFVEQSSLWTKTQQAFARDLDFRDNPPHSGFATVLRLYTCPSDPRTQTSLDLGNGFVVAFTDYLGVEGTNQYREDGMLYLDSQVRFADVTDGTSTTLLVGERPPSPEGHFGWWYGGMGQSMDGSADMLLGAQEHIVYPLYYSARCPLISPGFGPGNDRNVCDTFHFWSCHIGGANFLFVDGSVRFLSYSAASLLPALATRAGGEAVENP